MKQVKNGLKIKYAIRVMNTYILQHMACHIQKYTTNI